MEVSVRCQADAHARITVVSVLCIPVPESINRCYLVSVLCYWPLSRDLEMVRFDIRWVMSAIYSRICQKRFAAETWVARVMYGQGADKSLARPGRKQATFDQRLTSVSHSKKKKFRRLSVQPGLRSSHDPRVGRKMATFQLFFSVGSG